MPHPQTEFRIHFHYRVLKLCAYCACQRMHPIFLPVHILFLHLTPSRVWLEVRVQDFTVGALSRLIRQIFRHKVATETWRTPVTSERCLVRMYLFYYLFQFWRHRRSCHHCNYGYIIFCSPSGRCLPLLSANDWREYEWCSWNQANREPSEILGRPRGWWSLPWFFLSDKVGPLLRIPSVRLHQQFRSPSFLTSSMEVMMLPWQWNGLRCKLPSLWFGMLVTRRMPESSSCHWFHTGRGAT